MVAAVQPPPRKPAGSPRALVALLAFVLGIATVPHRVCERDAGAWFNGDAARTNALAASVARWTSTDLALATFSTGSRRYDGEWLFGTHMMAAMGFGQIALDPETQPAVREESILRMERSLDAMLGAGARTFDREAWGIDAIDSAKLAPGAKGDTGHVAYLGYAGLALGLHRVLRPNSRFAETDDLVVAVLARRIDASGTGFVETYPGEVYPVDNASALAAIALHARATKRGAPPALTKGLEAIKKHGTDASTGMLIQAVGTTDARPRDDARASGTALAAYFLAFADENTSAALWRALERRQFRTVLGFGAMVEYPDGKGRGDVDSGPVVFGFGVSATGFALGASRVHGDRDVFTALYATTHLFGAPFDDGGERTYATGGPLGDAILFAMLTAPPAARLRKIGGVA